LYWVRQMKNGMFVIFVNLKNKIVSH